MDDPRCDADERCILIEILQRQSSNTEPVNEDQIFEAASDYGMSETLAEERLRELQRRGAVHTTSNRGYRPTYQ